MLALVQGERFCGCPTILSGKYVYVLSTLRTARETMQPLAGVGRACTTATTATATHGCRANEIEKWYNIFWQFRCCKCGIVHYCCHGAL